MRRALLLLGFLVALPAAAAAWPAETMVALSRDARRLLPRSLARLLGEREPQIAEELRRFPPALGQALAVDLAAGGLRPETLAALDGEVDRTLERFRSRRFSEGLVALGALLRIPADLSDPVLAAGAEGWPPGVAQEYYALLDKNLDKMPVVLDDPDALKLGRNDLGRYWQGLLTRSRPQAPVIRAELFREGRLVDHRRLDYRSPAWAVGSLAYSRAVTAVAATWLAVWREARGDTTRMPPPRERAPKNAPAAAKGPPRPFTPEAP